MAEIVNLMELEPNIPTSNFGEYCTSLAAPPKWGKTEWATKYPKPFILDFEEGSKGKVVLRASVTKWSEVKKYINQMVKEPALKEKIETVVFDTVNYALEACKQYVMNEYQSKNPEKIIDTFNKIPFGQGWELLFKEFKAEINKLKRAGYGVVLISHVKTKEFEKESESAHYKTVPDLSDKERNLITAMADFMLLGEFETEIVEPATLDNNGKIVKEAVVETNRVLYLRTNNQAEAGFRWNNVPEKIPNDFELFKKIFMEALQEEIEHGKKKYGIDDSKANEIRKQLDQLREQEQKEVFEKENKAQTFSELIQAIKDVGTKLRQEKIAPVKEIKEVLGLYGGGNPDRYETIEEAQEVLDKLKKLLG